MNELSSLNNWVTIRTTQTLQKFIAKICKLKQFSKHILLDVSVF